MTYEQSIEAVIVAAGISSRAGAFKPGLPIGGKAMLVRCIEGVYDVCKRIIVVGGYRIEQLRPLVEGFKKAICIENPSYPKGMFTSVKAGLTLVDADRCFLLPGDVPLIPGSVYRALLAIDADIVVPTFQGTNGHPVCLSKNVIPRILQEPDNASLQDVIRIFGYRTLDVDAEEILLDVDTPEDYTMICQRVA